MFSPVPPLSWTERITQETDRRASGCFANRWIAAPVIGFVGVTGLSGVDTLRELAMMIAAGGCQLGRSVGLKNQVTWFKEGAAIHLYKAGQHALGAIAGLTLGLLAPSGVLFPVMKKIGFQVHAQTTPSVKKAIAIALSLFTVAYAIRTVSLPVKAVPIPPSAFSWGKVAAGVALVGTVGIVGLGREIFAYGVIL